MATALADAQILEGTWEEIQAYAADLSGHRLQIRILDDLAPSSKHTPEFWAEKMSAFDTRVKNAKPMTDAEWAEIHPVFGKQKPPLTAEESVTLRDIPGGTAPRQVKMALDLATAATDDARAWVEQEQAAREAVLSRG